LIESEAIYSSHPELAFRCHSFVWNDGCPLSLVPGNYDVEEKPQTMDIAEFRCAGLGGTMGPVSKSRMNS